MSCTQATGVPEKYLLWPRTEDMDVPYLLLTQALLIYISVARTPGSLPISFVTVTQELAFSFSTTSQIRTQLQDQLIKGKGMVNARRHTKQQVRKKLSSG